MTMTYQKFQNTYLVKGFTNKVGSPKHTRLVKHYFYMFNEELKADYGFDLSTCGECGCTSHNKKPIIMELEHINRDTSDSRIENLRSLCPNCHSQTDGYKNRKTTIEEYWSKLWGKVWNYKE